MYARQVPKSQNFGCDFCLWIMLIMKPGVNDNVIADTKIGPLSWELACSFNPNDPIKAKNCANGIQRVRKKFTYTSKMYGETPRQYVNSPAGCREKQIFPNFGNRYELTFLKLFGNNLSFLDFGEILMEDYWKSRDSGTPKMYFIIVLVLEVLMKNAA